MKVFFSQFYQQSEVLNVYSVTKYLSHLSTDDLNDDKDIAR